MKWLYKLDYKYGRHAIQNLMYYITGGMVAIFILDLLLTASGRIDSLYALLSFDRNMIAKGQVWRIISFIFLYPDSNMFFMIFAIYFYYMIGTSLENVWGSFRFNAYYFIGILGTLILGLITGYTTNTYINLSLFFAYAMLFPDDQVMLFFIIPIKIKYLAYLDALFFIISLILAPLPYKIALIFSIVNFFLFFYEDFVNKIKLTITHIKSKRSYRK